jgi:ankyrin repeat protein
MAEYKGEKNRRFATNNDYLVEIHEEVERGDLESIISRSLRGEDIWQANDSGGTICHRAAICGQVDIMKFISSDPSRFPLLEARGWLGYTVAHFAAMNGHLDILKHLHSIGIPLDVINNRGYTLAHEIVGSNQMVTSRKIEMLHYLHSIGCPMNLPNNRGQTPPSLTRDPEIISFYDHIM